MKLENKIDSEYIKRFFVGLLEGDGTITTNLASRGNRIVVRFVIALKNDVNNKSMLERIALVIGGRVVIERREKYVTWYATNNKDIKNILVLLEQYPLLTVRKQFQLRFAIMCFNKNINTAVFLSERANMYNDFQKQLLYLNEIQSPIPPYFFKAWLSGFIEAEGNFSLVFNDKNWLRKSAFSIGQNSELHILKMIRDYFESENKILADKVKVGSNTTVQHYRLSLYNEASRKLIFKHFAENPLLGQKNISYRKFFEFHKNKIVNKSVASNIARSN